MTGQLLSNYSSVRQRWHARTTRQTAHRATALVHLGRFDEAAEWAIRAAALPNAHAHMLAIAAFSLALADRPVEARAYLASIQKTQPQYQVNDLLTAMPFEPEGEKLFREGARRIGLK